MKTWLECKRRILRSSFLPALLLLAACTGASAPGSGDQPPAAAARLTGQAEDGIVAAEVRLERQADATWKLTSVIRNVSKDRTVDLHYECDHLMRVAGLSPLPNEKQTRTLSVPLRVAP
jgi:hypothetical protein